MKPKVDSRGVVRINLESVVFAPIFFLLGTAAAVVGLAITVGGVSSAGSDMAGILPLVIGAPIALLALHSWRSGVLRLVVDVPAGMIHLVRGSWRKSCALDALGPLEVAKHFKRSAAGSELRHLDWYRLEAKGLEWMLVDSPYEGAATRMRDMLTALVAKSAVRRILANAPVDGGAFRDGESLREQLTRAVPEPERLKAATASLTADPDVEVRERAATLCSPPCSPPR